MPDGVQAFDLPVQHRRRRYDARHHPVNHGFPIGNIQAAPPVHETQAIPSVNNLEQLRKRANAVLSDLQAAEAGYGFALPDPALTPDGRLFVLNTPGVKTLYQLQFGAWVAVS